MTGDPFEGRLLEGEHIVWSGRPKQGLMLMRRDALLGPFSLMWGGFAIFWEFSAVAGRHVPIVFVLWGIPFVLVGLYLIFGRFLVDAYIREAVFYAVTNERVLIVRRRPVFSMISLRLDHLPEISVTENAGGRGTIVFGARMLGRNGFGVWTPSLDGTPRFLGIAGVRGVFGIISGSVGRK